MKRITEEEMQGYVEGFKARAALREAHRKDLEARAAKIAAQCAERLRAIPEVRRVILYGSLAKGKFDAGSDIDLAVEGLPMESHFRVWAELERHADLTIDLHRWEELEERFRQTIQTYGRVLYERS